MKISELPEEIKKKALIYRGDSKKDDLKGAFYWHDTEEGSDFWLDWHLKESLSKKDTIVESVINKFKERSELGIKKYGVTLDRDDLTTLEWINHAQDEVMDMILYLEKLKTKL